MQDQFGVIKKMAQILGAIETYIYKNSRDYLPKHRSRFIDLCTIGLVEFEDEFFTYDQLKNLVANMVNQCESSSIKWRIDVDNCTDDQIAVICQPGQKRFVMPLSLFMASARVGNTTQNSAHG